MYYLIPCLHRAKWSGSWSILRSGLLSGSQSRICSVYSGHSLFNITKSVTIVFIVYAVIVWWFRNRNQPNIWIKFSLITIQIDCLHRTKFLDPEILLHVNAVLVQIKKSWFHEMKRHLKVCTLIQRQCAIFFHWSYLQNNEHSLWE